MLGPLVPSFLTCSWELSMRSPHLSNKAIQNCPGLQAVRAGYKGLLMLEAAGLYKAGVL